uniref:Uncharacterized protein n=1 Tax=Arundo donax TaxID=35708 RepID=A0A0A9A7D3_ARUDO
MPPGRAAAGSCGCDSSLRGTEIYRRDYGIYRRNDGGFFPNADHGSVSPRRHPDHAPQRGCAEV